MKKFFTDNRHNLWFWVFLAVAAILFVVMPIMSTGAGNSGDEDGFQIPQGNNVLQYYKTHHQDTTCLSFENLKYYGCSFDVVMAWFNNVFHVDDIHVTRHIANSLLGWIIVLFVGLIVWRIAGWRGAVLAMMLAFLSPRLLGHSFNNPKDIPLAAAVTMAIYYTLMFFRQAPKPKWSTMAMLAFSIAFAISIRIGGLIIIGYMGLWGVLWMCYRAGDRKLAAQQSKSKQKEQGNFLSFVDWGEALKTAAVAIVICVVGFFVGILLWPFAMQAPFKHAAESYSAMSQFAIAIRQIYEGQMVWSDALPWYYTPKFILTTIPVAVIIGWLLYPFLGAFRRERSMESIMLYFCFLFPVAWIVYTGANVYGGWRHSLFAYPPMVATAALGFEAFIAKCEGVGKNGSARPAWMRWCATVLPFVLLIPPAAHIVRNHPYEYIYFNELQGGTSKAFAKYEMDYYYHSMREATEWVMANATPVEGQTEQRIQVGTWHIASTRYFLHHDTTHFRPRFARWYSRGEYDWDYAVFPLTGIDPAYLTNEKVFPPKDMVYSIEVDGQPIAVVLRRNDRNDYIGSELKKAGNADSAMLHFRRALSYNPYNESVLLNMAELFLQRNQPDSALVYSNRFLEFEPTNDNANLFAAHAYALKGAADRALQICDFIIAHNFKYASAYQLKLSLLLQRNQLDAAEKEILRMIDLDQMNNQVAQYYVAIKRAHGLDERMAYSSLYKTMAESLEKRGKKQEAEMYRSYLRQM
ncbi:MAG: hypothetical protein IJV22_08980 [Bacteroidales bacterium]|nr:hypothetical protein [Bacteroidales bacterium]